MIKTLTRTLLNIGKSKYCFQSQNISSSIKAKRFDTMNKRGAFIVFEGCDRSGKTSQSLKLYERLNKEGLPCHLMRFPERKTQIGQVIDSYLRNATNLEDHVIHLLFSANRWELEGQIKSKLQEGVTVVLDRYAYSGVAFSAAKQGLDLDWCKQPDIGLPQPDLVLFLNITPKQAAQRQEYGHERYENEIFQAKVYEYFLQLKDSYWQMVNAEQSFEDIHQELFDHSMQIINKVGTSPIGRLWLLKETEPKKAN